MGANGEAGGGDSATCKIGTSIVLSVTACGD